MVQRKREIGMRKRKKNVGGVCGQWFVRYNKELKKYYYLNKINGKIDKLIWMFCKNKCVK